ncbi:MAG: cytochrome c oxidase subunit II [Verrucomicrobia bacterium]|nr:cytochrome c oxidase subunit II [Verrucomicrobiota bacterium]
MINRLMGMPESFSEHGREIDFSLELCHWFMALLFIGWLIYFIYTIVRFRKARNPRADHVGATSLAPYYLIGGVVIFDAVLLIGFDIPLWTERVTQYPDEKEAVMIHVIAQQFAWNIHYPGPDGIFGKRSPKLVSEDNPIGLDSNDPHARDDVVSFNSLHAPVHKPVIIRLTSKDVIHSLKIIQMRVTQDAIPGMNIPVWFVPTKTGQYEIVCAQLCGNSHYRMRGILTVDSEQDYAAWLKSQPAFGGE